MASDDEPPPAGAPEAGDGPLRAMSRLLDPLGVNARLLEIQQAWLRNPLALAEAAAGIATRWQALNLHVLARMGGLTTAEPERASPDDERFTDPAWSENPTLSALKQYYLLVTRCINDLIYATPGIDQRSREEAAFWLRQWLNAQAPTNYFLTNPVAVRRFIESRGGSVLDGMRNFFRDAQAGDIQMVDRGAFRVGGNLATTEGAVVHRSPLLELIHYRARAAKVRAMPLVIVTPWINKYYILDLNERKSLVRHLLEQGFDVYITSWKNPGADMADTGLDDYGLDGALAAVEVARALSGAPQVHLVGYCLGGTTVAALMAWLAREYPDAAASPVAHWTLFAALVDFSQPGDLGVFVHQEGVELVERMMAEKGYLDGAEMARSFRLLRPNSLIWHYFVHGYLYGEELPAFDVLFWNVDTTRMPRAMHSFYLRELYLNNRLARPGALELRGHRLDLGLVGQPLYAVGSQEDHITPWEQTFATTQLVGGPSRYVLSTSGHILGIVNPPVDPPRRAFFAGEVAAGESALAWRKRMSKTPGTWWPDWTGWLHQRCGALRAPPPLTDAAHPALADAPGTYVLEP